jgi:hypothetical protein
MDLSPFCRHNKAGVDQLILSRLNLLRDRGMKPQPRHFNPRNNREMGLQTRIFNLHPHSQPQISTRWGIATPSLDPMASRNAPQQDS